MVLKSREWHKLYFSQQAEAECRVKKLSGHRPITEADANCSKNLQIGVQVSGSSYKAFFICIALLKKSYEKKIASALVEQFVLICRFHINSFRSFEVDLGFCKQGSVNLSKIPYLFPHKNSLSSQ